MSAKVISRAQVSQGLDDPVPLGDTVVFIGDSITAAHWAGTLGTTLLRVANVVTAIQPGHPMMTGQSVLVERMLDVSFNGFYPIMRTGSNTYTYACPGPDTDTSGGLVRNPYWLADNGWITWARILSGNRFSMLFNAGVGGNTLAQMLARLQSDVSARNPAWCSVMGGINDIASLSALQIIALLTEIFRQLRKSGIRIIAHTILPLAIGHASYSVGNYQKILEVNAWVRRECLINRNMRLCDSYRAIVDPFSLTGQPRVGYLAADFIHPTSRGAKAIGEMFVQATNMDLGGGNTLICSPADNRSVSTANSNLWPSMPITTSGGVVAGTATGTPPSGFKVQSTVGSPIIVASGVLRSLAVHGDDLGAVCRMMFQAQAANDTGQITQNGSGWAATVAIGRAYYFECALDVINLVGSNLSSLVLSVVYVVDGISYTSYALQPSNTSFPVTDFRGVLYTVPFFLTGILATNIVVALTCKASAAGTPVQIDAGRVQLRELLAGANLLL